jgi:hypothetical protein
VIGSSYLSVTEVRGLAVAERAALAQDTVIATLTWPADRPRVILDADMLPADVADTTKGLRLHVDIADGQGGWLEWCWVAVDPGKSRANGPWLNYPAPPAGASVRMRLAPLGGQSVTAGALVRGGTTKRRSGQ